MSNICENKFYIYSSITENTKKIEEKLENLFNNKLDGEITYCDEFVLEGYFDSRWEFPEELFADFFDEFKDDEELYMRCLSEEWGMNLCSMNIYKNGAWCTPQYFDV